MSVISLLIPGLGVQQNIIAKWRLDVEHKVWPSSSIAPGYVISEALEKCKMKSIKSPAWLDADYIQKSKALALDGSAVSTKLSSPGKIYLSVF